MQKALRSMETGLTGFDDVQLEGLGQGDDKNVVRAAVSRPTFDRILKVAQAFREDFSLDEIHQYCKIDPWFLAEIKAIVDTEARVIAHGLPKTATQLRALKAQGFSDARLAKLAKLERSPGAADAESAWRSARLQAHRHVRGRVRVSDSPTCIRPTRRASAASPPARPQPTAKEKIVILGGGPNRIGQGIEFDYCCCHACFALTAAGFETIMVNCNPETVSTDYDTSDRLFFEPLTAEDVLEIIRVESGNGTLKGVIVQFGGQTPLKLASALEEAGVPILGTSPDAIDLAEDRDRFKALIEKLKLSQPKSGIAKTPGEARAVAEAVGYPVVIRPSYVLGGRGMEIVHDGAEVDRYVTRLSATLDRPSELVVSDKRPLLIDSYLTDAVEVDVDCLSDGKDTFVAGIMEHIEEAGIHSGDSACSLPPYSLSPQTIAELERQTRELALALRVVGLMNVQFAIKDGHVFILEVNPRASRTVPFVAKVVGLPIAAIAAQIMGGKPLAAFNLKKPDYDHVAVKEAVFPFARFLGVDPILGPEMRSTGEVMGIDRDFAMAFGKSQLGAGQTLPSGGTVFVSVKENDKARVVGPVKELAAMGFKVVATRGTKRFLEANGIQCDGINKVLEGRPHIVDAIKNGDIQLVFNTTEGSKALSDSKDIRRTALLHHIPYYTTLAGAVAVTRAIKALTSDTLQVAPLQAFAHR